MTKSAGVIHQCTRCFSLRAPDGEPCETCRVKLNATTTATTALAFGDVSSDAPPAEAFFVVGAGAMGRA